MRVVIFLHGKISGMDGNTVRTTILVPICRRKRADAPDRARGESRRAELSGAARMKRRFACSGERRSAVTRSRRRASSALGV